jgi:hypothetical protein
MKSPSFLCLLATSLTVCSAFADDPKPLFNGKDLTGWKPAEPASYWKVVDGVLVGESDAAKKPSMLYTEKSFQDVAVEAEVRWSGDIDSGIMLRKPEIQVQIGTSRSLKRDMTCCLYLGKYPEEAQAKGKDALLKVGDWNKIRFEAKGDHFQVWLNGTKVTDYHDSKYSGEAPMGLQIHGGVQMKVEFRNIRAQELSSR